ncbi:hypothetical protein QA597_09125 [Marinilabiliaceae bacterium ANBcel2]|nr:hypothetical protein [Marinilabiliaceae bacterium ANBcel2]
MRKEQLKKISSHYILLPTKGLQKWPVITVNKKGEIVSLKYGSLAYTEEPGTEMHPGVIIPAFYDLFVSEKEKCAPTSIQDTINHFIGGTIELGATPTNKTVVLKSKVKIGDPINLTKEKEAQFLVRKSNNYKTPLFERIKSAALTGKEINHINLINTAVASVLKYRKKQELSPLIEVGGRPGLLILKGADLKNFKLKKETKVKWLVKPTFTT